MHKAGQIIRTLISNPYCLNGVMQRVNKFIIINPVNYFLYLKNIPISADALSCRTWSCNEMALIHQLDTVYYDRSG
jgi:hypothetical protein